MDSASDSFVPVWVNDIPKLTSLRLDPHVSTELVVDLSVEQRLASAPIVLSSQYRATPASRLATVAELLGDPEAGFAIVPPFLPRAILTAAAVDSGRASWSSEQTAYYNELVMLMSANADLIRGKGESAGTPVRRGKAVAAFRALVSQKRVEQVWPQHAITNSWADLLVLPSRVLEDKEREVQQPQKQRAADHRPVERVYRHDYRLRLCFASNLVAYAVGCFLVHYSLARFQTPDVVKSLQAILDGKPWTSQTDTDVSGSSSSGSDSDTGYVVVGGQSHRAAAAKQRRGVRDRKKELAKLQSEELSGDDWLAESKKPLLQFVTTANVRGWERHYVECSVGNWQSVGCGQRFDSDDDAFQRVVAALPELREPAAAWSLRRAIGGTLVSLFVRDDLIVLLPAINDRLRQLAMDTWQYAALEVSCRVHPRRVRGQRGGSDIERRYLTAKVASAPPRMAPLTDGRHPHPDHRPAQRPRPPCPRGLLCCLPRVLRLHEQLAVRLRLWR